MTFLERLLIVIFFLVILYILIKLISHKASQYNDTKSNILFWDKRIIVLPIIFAIMLLFLIFLAVIFPSLVINKEASVFLVLPLILCLYILLRCINWKIEFRMDDFEYTSMLGKKYQYKYSEIKKLTTSLYGEVIKVGKKKIIVDGVFTIGKSEFINEVDESRIVRKYKPKHK